jgi:hypothetical protein
MENVILVPQALDSKASGGWRQRLTLTFLCALTSSSYTSQLLVSSSITRSYNLISLIIKVKIKKHILFGSNRSKDEQLYYKIYVPSSDIIVDWFSPTDNAFSFFL